MDWEIELGVREEGTSDGGFSHGRAEGGFPAKGEPADEGFLIKVSKGEAGGVDSAE